MLCGVRLRLDPYSIAILKENPSIEYKSQYHHSTWDVEPSMIGKIHGMTIVIVSDGYGYIKGSLHMYKNAGQHNYDDFTWEDAFRTIENLSELLGIDIGALDIIRLEWGVNIQLDKKPSAIIPHIVMHMGEGYKDDDVSKGRLYVCPHTDYRIKCYDKSAKYRNYNNVPENLMRIEVSTEHARLTKSFGAYKLHHLHSDKIKQNLIKFLIEEAWNKTLVIDPFLFQLKPKTRYDEKNILNWRNPLFWLNATRKTRYNNLKKYQGLLSTLATTLQKEIEKKIRNKTATLLRIQD